MTDPTQKQITKYVKGAIQFPLDDGQLVAMVILHFDIPDKVAKRKTERALIDLAKVKASRPDREKIAEIIATKTDNHFQLGGTWEKYPEEFKEQYRLIADQIIALLGERG